MGLTLLSGTRTPRLDGNGAEVESGIVALPDLLIAGLEDAMAAVATDSGWQLTTFVGCSTSDGESGVGFNGSSIGANEA